MASRHEVFGGNMSEEHSPLRGSLSSNLYKKETKIPQGQEWARELIEQIPRDLLPVVTAFLMENPAEAQKRAKTLSDVMGQFSEGLLGADDPLATLQYCLSKAEARLAQGKDITH